ncbi:MAG: KH domain-containing protein [Atribacterota bacterium]|nr:KH domain-containing protein [Atribacterota bacterium]
MENIDNFKTSHQEKAKATLEEIINFITDDGEVQIINKEGIEEIVLEIKTSNSGILIGKHGHTLDALQYIVNVMVNKEIDESERRRIIIDTEGYREKREETVSKYAREKAEIVKRTGKKIDLYSMNSTERRIVHLVLQGDPLLVTYSEGTEPFRKIVIALKENGNSTNNIEEEQ